MQTDHSAIVKWYKGDLCTISGLLGQRRRWHEFLSRFNLIITYREGKENQVSDALSRFTYPAGESQDTNFHGRNEYLEGRKKTEAWRVADGTGEPQNGRAGSLFGGIDYAATV